MKLSKKQRERARRIRELKKNRWCRACRRNGAAPEDPRCAPCHDAWSQSETHPDFVARRIGRKEVVP